MVKLKICGMRRSEDIEMANRHKPDYIGFVFAESPRKVSGIIEMAQLHGDEDEKYIRNLKDKSIEETGKQIPVINAIEIKDGADYNDELLKWRDSASDYFILDSGKGSGKTFDWSLIDIESEFFKNSIFLAGGLNSENLALAIGEFNPFAVDLSSSVETDGFKDEEKIKDIIKIMENYR